MSTTTILSPVRSVATMSDAELHESARLRVFAAADRYGMDSPQVAATLRRRGRYTTAQADPDDLMALIDAALDPRVPTRVALR